MFVTFFVSDKGRKFFHFLRQLMIEGKQKNGAIIPSKLIRFALITEVAKAVAIFVRIACFFPHRVCITQAHPVFNEAFCQPSHLRTLTSSPTALC
jgi:hypothetical protein